MVPQTLLTLFCKRRSIQYMQGLNELLAPFFLVGLQKKEEVPRRWGPCRPPTSPSPARPRTILAVTPVLHLQPCFAIAVRVSRLFFFSSWEWMHFCRVLGFHEESDVDSDGWADIQLPLCDGREVPAEHLRRRPCHCPACDGSLPPLTDVRPAPTYLRRTWARSFLPSVRHWAPFKGPLGPVQVGPHRLANVLLRRSA